MGSSDIDEKKMAEIIEYAEKKAKDFKKYGLQYSHIAEQTGLTANEVKSFFNLSSEIGDEDYEKIYEKMKQFFASEEKLDQFKHIDDEKFTELLNTIMDEFSCSYKKLQDMMKKQIGYIFREHCTEENIEFTEYQLNKRGIDNFMKLSEQLAQIKDLEFELSDINYMISCGGEIPVGYDPETGEEIMHKVNVESLKERRSHLEKLLEELSEPSDMDEQDWKEFREIKQQSSNNSPEYKEVRRKEKAEKRSDRHKMTYNDYAYNTYQQRAILEYFFKQCTDDNGYVLPEHFGTGIQLSRIIQEKFHYIATGYWRVKIKFKVGDLATKDNLEKYGFGSSIPEIKESDPVYSFILGHKRVFFHDPCVKAVKKLSAALSAAPAKVKDSLFDMLAENFKISSGDSCKADEYNQTLAQYLDIISSDLPIAKLSEHSKEEIYRIVYEIANASDGSIRFNNELVDDVCKRLYFKKKQWNLMAYLSCYYFTNKEIGSLISYIEKETGEPEK